MARTTRVAVACMLASAVVQAIQCSSGGECPSDDKPQNIVSLLQTQDQMNVFKDGGEAASTGTNTFGPSARRHPPALKASPTGLNARSILDLQAHAPKREEEPQRSIKLIVNSDVRYSGPLQTLFDSLEKVSFDRWNDVVVMRGSASNNSDPFTPDTKYGKLGVQYINLNLSSFDYHGFSGLHRHRNDPRVKADVYFYIHDTVLANSTFPSIFDSMASTEKFEARHPPLPCNNLCVFGSGVVDAYGNQFDAPVTKAIGADIEDGVDNVVKFAKKQTMLEKRVFKGYGIDVWHTGYPRGAIYFPSYGLTKYVLWDKFGDLAGNIQNTLR